MAAASSHTALMKVSATDGSYVTVANTTSVTMERGRRALEDNVLGNSYESALAGRTHGGFPFEINYDSAGTDTQHELIISSEDSGADIWVQVLPNGTAGRKCKCKIFDVALSMPGNGVCKLTGRFQFIATSSSV